MTNPGIGSLLSDVYGTGANAATHTEEDLAKEASLQYFGALCQREGIDVAQLDEPQVLELYKVAMELKVAEESAEEEKKEEGGKKNLAPPFGKHEAGESKGKEEKEEKEGKEKEAAAAEWAEKRAAYVKVAEADATGRIMAHAMVDELRKIAAEQEAAAAPAPTATEKAAAVIASARAKTASAPAQAAPAVVSDTPNFDKMAALQAITMLKEAGVDEAEAHTRISAAYTLGLETSTKIAAIADPDAALTVRALEFCEAAKYPVDWSQQ